MILRSGKIVTERPKHSSAVAVDTNIAPYEIKQNEEEEEEDIISSRLPDEIITHILSLLPDADAYRTRILSKRWNHLCFFLPFLCFKMPPSYKYSVEVINKFYDFVDKTFSLRNRDMRVIKRFFLSCSNHYDRKRVLDWLRIVLHSKLLHTLDLRFPSDGNTFSLSWDLLMTRNNSLVDLNLKNVNMVGLEETQLRFPFLKRLKLKSIEYSGDESLRNLISACPVLHELCLNDLRVHPQLQTFKITSPSLKRLIIQWCDFGKCCKVVIDAPKLEYLHITEDETATYSLTNSSSLVEAHINKYMPLSNVSSARILTLGSDSLLGLNDNAGLNLPVFPNLVKLIVDFNTIPAWDKLFILLNKMPYLQHITIGFGWNLLPFRRRCNPPTEAPPCLRFMMKEVVIDNENAAVQVKDHVDLIRYLLNHSSVLEKLTLHTNDIDREELLKIRRNSKSCQIQFI